MSYCVQCGVELAASEKRCPLCDTPVVNPNAPAGAFGEPPYPRELEHIARKIDRRYGMWLATLALLLPMAVSLVVDICTSEGGWWSLYVLGAGACLWVWVLLPLWKSMQRPYVYLALDIAALASYLLLVWAISGGGRWYLHLALPLCLVLGLYCVACVFIKRRESVKGLHKPGWMILIGACMIVALECVIDDFLWESVRLGWSLYTAVPLASLSLACRIIEKKQQLKDSIRKRLYI